MICKMCEYDGNCQLQVVAHEFKEYPQLKRFYARAGVLWSAGYFISSVGHISESTVKKYIEEQKHGKDET